MAQSAFSGAAPRRRRAASSISAESGVAPMSVERQESALMNAGRNVMSGLGYVGGTLSKPQRALWGTINGLTGGEWGGGLLNLLPFSDTLGITDPSKEVLGSTVAERAGLIPKNTPGFDRWDPLRFGVDVLTDPLTYVGAGLFGHGGKAAARVGSLADDAIRSTMAATGKGWRQAAAATTGRDVLKYAASVGKGKEAARAYSTAAKQAGKKLKDIADLPVGGIGFRLPFTQGAAYTGRGAETARKVLDAPGQWFRNVRGPAASAAGQAAEVVAPRAAGPVRDELVSTIQRGASERDLGDAMRELSGSASQVQALPKELADQFDAHGATLKDMMNLLDNGIDDSRSFHTAPLSDTMGNSQGIGLRTFQPFIAVSERGKTLKDGIGAVIVDPLHAPNIPELQKLYPDVQFISAADDLAGGLGAVGAKAAAGGQAAARSWSNSKIGNVVRGLFHPESGNRFDRVGQEVNQISRAALDRNKPAMAEALQGIIDKVREPLKMFEDLYGDAFRGAEKEGFTPGQRVQFGGLQGEISRVMGKTAEVYTRNAKSGAEQWHRVPLEKMSADTGKALQSSRMYSTFEKVLHTISEGSDVDSALKLIEGEMRLPAGSLTKRMSPEDFRKAIGDAATHARNTRDPLYQSAVRKGIRSGAVENHVPRYDATDDLAALEAGRQRITKDLGKVVINKLMADKELRGPNAAAHLFKNYIKPGLVKLDDKYESLLHEGASGRQAHLDDLLSYVGDHDQKWIYTRDFVSDNAKYIEAATRANAMADGIHEMVKRSAQEGGDVSLRQVFASSGLDVKDALQYQSDLTGIPVAQLEKMSVPREVAAGLKGMAKFQTDPEWLGVIGKAMDRFHRLFKESVTIQPAFVGYFTRNFGSGQFMNAASGYIDNLKDIGAYAKQLGRSMRDVKNGFKDVTEAELRELQRYRVLGDTGFEGVEHYGGAPPDPFAWGSDVSQVRPGNPLAGRETLREARQAVAEAPLEGFAAQAAQKVPGLGKAVDAVRTGWQTNVRTGSKMNQNVEWLNRVTMFRYLKAKGFTPKAAAEEILKSHFDYGNLTKFERDVMKRLVPFYSFTRKMNEQFFNTLIDRPGGLMGKAIRASSSVAEPGTPDHVAGTTALPLGEQPDGSKRYVTGFGMPYEDPASFFGGGVRGLGLEALSRSSPLIKGPLEWSTGESFFQTGPGGGRDLNDADPALGRTLSNVMGYEDPVRLPEGVEHILSNAPSSRYVTMLRQLTDKRKGLGTKAFNLLSGIRISDVSPSAQDAVLREHLTDAARRAGAGAFERVSFRKGDKLTPAQKEVQAALNALADRAKRRKKKKPAAK